MKKVLVTRKHTGIGSDLMSVIGALDFAIRTGRELIIDWRNSRYLSDSKTNLFSLLFDIPPYVEGCRITIADSNFDDSTLPQPVLQSDAWAFADYHQSMLDGQDRPESALIVTRPMHHLPGQARQAALLSHITPTPDLLKAIHEFRAARFTLGQTIGVHVRHGNGEPLLQRRGKLIRRGVARVYQKCLTALADMAMTDATLFLCTDSDEVRSYFCEHFPKTIFWPSRLLGAGEGPIHTNDFGLDGARDAVIEMYLLRETNGIIFNPSWFSHPARMMGTFIQPPFNIDNNSSYGTMEVYDKRVGSLSESKGICGESDEP